MKGKGEMKKKFSICIPVYKNEKNLPITIPYIIQHLDLFQEFDVEIVMVNDGSPDNSYQVMQEFQKQYPDIIRIATLTRNFGQGACTHCCLSMAQGDVLGVIAADMQEPLELFVDMLEEWKQGYKLVIASREARNDKGIGIWFSQALHRFIHKYINERYPVGGFDFLVMDREVLDKYLPLDREDAFGQLKLLWLGYEYKELKYTRREREVGKSGWTLGKKIETVLGILVDYSAKPIHFLMGTGVFLTAGAIVAMLVLLILAICKVAQISLVAFIIPILFFLGGVNLTGIGLIGEYIWRNFEMNKNLPRFVKKED